MPPKKLDELLNSNKNEGLSTLVDRAEAIGALTQAVQNALPPDLTASLIAANTDDDGQLIVVARSPAFAARLRFEHDALIAAAKSAGESVESVKIRVAHDAS